MLLNWLQINSFHCPFCSLWTKPRENKSVWERTEASANLEFNVGYRTLPLGVFAVLSPGRINSIWQTTPAECLPSGGLRMKLKHPFFPSNPCIFQQIRPKMQSYLEDNMVPDVHGACHREAAFSLWSWSKGHMRGSSANRAAWSDGGPLSGRGAEGGGSWASGHAVGGKDSLASRIMKRAPNRKCSGVGPQYKKTSTRWRHQHAAPLCRLRPFHTGTSCFDFGQCALKKQCMLENNTSRFPAFYYLRCRPTSETPVRRHSKQNVANQRRKHWCEKAMQTP